MSNNAGSRTALIAASASMAGVTITSAIFEALVFSDWTAPVVLIGLIAGGLLAVATVVLMSNPETGAWLAMIGGLITLLAGVAELAMVGLVWQAPQAAQPAWLQEFVYVVAGAFIAGVGLRVWRPREVSQRTGPHPA